LRGIGREPIGAASSGLGGATQVTKYDQINSPATTHRYDLLEADPAKPYLPKQDADGNYVPLDPSIATVDSETGKIETGKGQHGRVYAVAVLSVGPKAASWPLVFEPRRSYTPPAPHPPPPPPASTPPQGLNLLAKPVGLNVAPQSSPIPPPSPPIQPAPPGGAPREARQRQAAAAKSEEGARRGASEGVEALGG